MKHEKRAQKLVQADLKLAQQNLASNKKHSRIAEEPILVFPEQEAWVRNLPVATAPAPKPLDKPTAYSPKKARPPLHQPKVKKQANNSGAIGMTVERKSGREKQDELKWAELEQYDQRLRQLAETTFKQRLITTQKQKNAQQARPKPAASPRRDDFPRLLHKRSDMLPTIRKDYKLIFSDILDTLEHISHQNKQIQNRVEARLCGEHVDYIPSPVPNILPRSREKSPIIRPETRQTRIDTAKKGNVSFTEQKPEPKMQVRSAEVEKFRAPAKLLNPLVRNGRPKKRVTLDPALAEKLIHYTSAMDKSSADVMARGIDELTQKIMNDLIASIAEECATSFDGIVEEMFNHEMKV